MENKIYVWISQEYEDIVDVKAFTTKQKALDYAYEDSKNVVNHLTDDYLTCGHNISPTEMRNKMLSNLQEQYQKGNLDYFGIREVELF